MEVRTETGSRIKRTGNHDDSLSYAELHYANSDWRFHERQWRSHAQCDFRSVQKGGIYSKACQATAGGFSIVWQSTVGPMDPRRSGSVAGWVRGLRLLQ